MATGSDSFIFTLLSTSSKALNMMTFLALVHSSRKEIAIVRLVALAPAHWTNLVATNNLVLHSLIEVVN
jgi:hypothetical protein